MCACMYVYCTCSHIYIHPVLLSNTVNTENKHSLQKKCTYLNSCMYVYTDTPWLMYSYILEDPVQVKFSSSQNSVHKWSALGMYPWESSWNPDSSTPNLLPVLSPTCILPKHTTNFAFVARRTNLVWVLKILWFLFSSFSLFCLFLF